MSKLANTRINEFMNAKGERDLKAQGKGPSVVSETNVSLFGADRKHLFRKQFFAFELPRNKKLFWKLPYVVSDFIL